MKNANIGIANLVISNKLKDSYFNNSLLEESKKLTTDFLDVVKNSPILQLEFKVFSNIENKHIENDLAATRYIDNNIKLFEVYTIAEIETERERLNQFLQEEILTKITEGALTNDLDKINLYTAIDTLITETLNDYDKIDTDAMHEAFTIVLNHVKTQKKKLVESHEVKPINEDVIEIAINKFNEKYDELNEVDKNLLKKLIKSNDDEKLELLEEYKKECLLVLESVSEDKKNDKVINGIKKIREMSYGVNTNEFSQRIIDDIVNLHEFKKAII